ncbi:MAG: thioredoxin domain-containing protein [Phycisphaerae bacterium]|nr:thioredoxin domain-containing protein [Phycisphaerae bacterium]
MRRTFSIIAAFLALIAAWISFELLVKHVSGHEGAPWFAALCTDQPNSRMNCDAVLRSPYSVFPPQRPGEPVTNSIPVAFLGLAYYSVLACWLIAVGPVSHRRWYYHLLPVGLVSLGLLGSAYYMWVMFTKLNEWCPWCAITHGMNLLIALGVFAVWPRRTAAGEDGASSAKPDRRPAMAPYPTHQLALVTVALMIAVFYAQVYIFKSAVRAQSATVHKINFDGCMAELNRVIADGNALVFLWMQSPKQELPIRPDDAIRIHAEQVEYLVPAMIFSDFQCSSCRRAGKFLDEQVQPLFGGHLAVVYRHYPLDKSCNPYVQNNMHPHACEGSRWAEAARVVVGLPAFWKAHDYIYEHQDELAAGTMTAEHVAKAVGADPEAFVAAANSEEVKQRIRADIELGARLQLGATPTVYFQGRRIDKLAVKSLGFWDRLAEQYWIQRDVPRPESAMLKKDEATEGSPGPSGAPSPGEAPPH